MAVPKRKTSGSRRGMRRSHDHLIPPGVARCSRCNHAIKPHHVCANCGYYGDNQVVDVEAGRG